MAERTVPQLFTQIKKFGAEGLFNKALPLVQEVLKKEPKDIEALRCKVVCLMKLDKCKEAYHVMTTDKTLLTMPLWFERAYCLYRQGKLDEAITELTNAEKNPQVEELFAQIYYKLENYEDAVDIYKALVKNTVDAYTNERETNLAAALASSAAFKGKPLKWAGVRESTYELCYNSSCYALATGDVSKAEDMLGRATAMCNKEFEDDPEEAKSELAPIQVQQAVCMQRQGDNKEAMNIYTNIIKEKAGDTQTIAVAANNIISINKDQNMFDSKKKLKLASGETIDKKLSRHQIISVDFNQCLLSYYTNQLDQFKKQSLRLSEEGSPLAPLLLATSHIRDKRQDLALNVLAASDLSNETVLLALGELQLNANSLSDAADTLQKISSWFDKPGLLSTVISLLMASRSPGEASGFFDEAVKRLRNTGNYTSEQISEWTLENARFKMSHDMPENAAEVLESLLLEEPSNIKALALLISSVSTFDAPRAYEVAQRLPAITIPDDVDVDALEMGVGVTSGRGLRKVIKPDEEKIKEANRK